MADLSLEDQNFVVKQTELIAELEENVFTGDVILEVRPAFRDKNHDEPKVGLTAIRAYGDNKHSTQDGGIGVLGIGAKDSSGTGVKGIGKTGVLGESGSSLGVQGNGRTGVQGVTDQTGIGVQGLADQGQGVWGQSKTGPGVFGRSDDGNGVAAFSNNGNGVDTVSSNGVGVRASGEQGGVHGTSDKNHAVFGDNGKNPPQGHVLLNATTGCYAMTRQNRGVAGVLGREGIDANDPRDIGVYAAGVYGSSEHHTRTIERGVKIIEDKGFAGLFWGPVLVLGNFVAAGGIKSGAVRHEDGSHRLVYSMESPETWFEDFGEAKLVRGKARVGIRPDFAAIVNTGSYQVFLTPYGDSAGLYIASREADHFQVREQGGGRRSLSFAFRIVAHPRDSESKRLAKINLPPLPKIPRKTAR